MMNDPDTIRAALRRAILDQEEARRIGRQGRGLSTSRAVLAGPDPDPEAIAILARLLRRGPRGRQLLRHIILYAGSIPDGSDLPATDPAPQSGHNSPHSRHISATIDSDLAPKHPKIANLKVVRQ